MGSSLTVSWGVPDGGLRKFGAVCCAARTGPSLRNAEMCIPGFFGWFLSDDFAVNG